MWLFLLPAALAAPDLDITLVVAECTAPDGDPTIRVRVANRGEASAGFWVDVYRIQYTDVSFDFDQVGEQYARVPSLDGYAETDVVFVFPGKGGWTGAGIAQVDLDEEIWEGNEHNNFGFQDYWGDGDALWDYSDTFGLLDCPSYPDLVVESVSPPFLDEDGNPAVTIRVRNLGLATAAESILYWKSPDDQDWIDLAPLAGGDSVEVTSTFSPALHEEEFTLYTFVDGGWTVDELDEQNAGFWPLELP